MSKAAKTKTDKHGKAAPTTATPQLISEIIPGKFTDSDWLAVLQLDDNEDFIGSIVQEIRQTVDEKIKVIEIERQLAPYAVGQVMNFVLDLFKLAYPEHQECQEADYSWEADFPPECSVIDSWAEGSVPKQIKVEVVSIAEEFDQVQPSVEESFTEQDDMSKIDGEMGTTMELVGPSTEEGALTRPVPPGNKRVPVQVPVQTKSKAFKPNVSVLSVQRAIGMLDDQPPTTGNYAPIASSSTRSKVAGSSKAAKTALVAAVGKASLQREKGRPPMEKDVNYDAFGNIVSMIRISPESFPPLFVQTDYMVVDPRVERANAELEAMRTGRYLHATNDQRRLHVRQPFRLKPLYMTPALAAIKLATDVNSLIGDQNSSGDNKSKASLVKLPSESKQQPYRQQAVGEKVAQARSIIEQIDLSPGVDIREGSQEKRGADLRLISGAVFLHQDATLQPMAQRPQVTAKLMDVNQLIAKAPMIKPASVPVA